MEQHKQGSGFLNGLVIGLVVGAGFTLLLTTKKGKRILKAINEEGLDSVTSLDDLYQKFEKAVQSDTNDDEADEVIETNEEYPRKKIFLAHDEQTSAKLAEVQERLDKEIEDVSESVASTYVAYADETDIREEEDDIEEKPIVSIKPTRRRFFRGIPRRA